MPFLYEVCNLDVSFNTIPVLKNISFKINAGEFLGIIGPNGSGKSTLLRTMAGMLKPANGNVKLDEKDISKLPRREIAHRLAVVPQESPVAFEYTVLEIVLMGRSPHIGRFKLESEKDTEIAIEALRRTNLLIVRSQ